MADSPTRFNLPNQSGKQELPMELRLLLAFLLMGIVVFVTPLIYKPAPAPKRTAPAPTPAQAAQMAQKPAVAAAAPAIPVAEASGRVAANSEQKFTVNTDLYTIVFSNRGASIRSWQLKKFAYQSGKNPGKPLELVNQASLDKVPPPLSIQMQDEKAATTLNYAYFIGKQSEDRLTLDFDYSDGKLACHKSFHFAKNSYLSEVDVQVLENNAPVPHMLEWRGGFGDETVLNRGQAQHAVHYDLTEAGFFSKQLVRTDAKEVKNNSITYTGNYSFAGLDDTFFAFAVLPKDNSSTRVIVMKDDVPSPLSNKDEPHVGTAIGGDSQNQFTVFVGPKDVDVISKIDPKLQQLIDWGRLWFIAKPLFQAVHYLNDHILHNYGWSIVVITIIINLALLPLRLSSMKSARKMQGLQPQIQAINAKYKNISMRDPRKADQNQEIMDLYKKHGANPLGGCLPMVIQLPILWAFYTVLTVTIELRGAHWLWVSDLSQPEQLPIHILPIIMIVTQFLMQRMTPNPTMDPAQARMMQFMPLMFGFFFYSMSSGLVLYWLTGNLVGIVQQYLINKYTPAPVPVPVPAKPAPKKVLKR